MERLGCIFWRKTRALKMREIRKGRLLLTFGQRDGDEKMSFNKENAISFVLTLKELGDLRLALTSTKHTVELVHKNDKVTKNLTCKWEKGKKDEDAVFTLLVSEKEGDKKRNSQFSLEKGEVYIFARLIDGVIDKALVEDAAEGGKAAPAAENDVDIVEEDIGVDDSDIEIPI